VLVFSPLVTNLFQHGFRGVKPSKMSNFRFLKTQMTKFYFTHVQTVLKITSSAVETRFSRLEQSLSWIFMKSAVIKITAYWGQTPPQKSDRRCIHNHFWPTSRKKVFKIGRKSTVASAVILTLGQKSAVPAQCGVEFKKKNCSAGAREHAWSMIIKKKFPPCTQWAPQ
jgi:hypothetical protein